MTTTLVKNQMTTMMISNLWEIGQVRLNVLPFIIKPTILKTMNCIWVIYSNKFKKLKIHRADSVPKSKK
jgi:hypothetical protein